MAFETLACGQRFQQHWRLETSAVGTRSGFSRFGIHLGESDGFPVLDQYDKQAFAYLKQVNAELTRGLRRCHFLIEDCRAHLTPANSNEEPFMLVSRPADDDGRHG
jgi:hypothetical protein